MLGFIKNSLLITFLLLALNSEAFANKIKPSLVNGEQYPLEFKLVKVERLCPDNEHGISCKALGSTITVEAYLKSCVDEVKSFDYTTYRYDDVLIMEIESLGIANPMADRVRCVRPGVFRKKIHVMDEYFVNVKVINILLDSEN